MGLTQAQITAGTQGPSTVETAITPTKPAEAETRVSPTCVDARPNPILLSVAETAKTVGLTQAQITAGTQGPSTVGTALTRTRPVVAETQEKPMFVVAIQKPRQIFARDLVSAELPSRTTISAVTK